MKKIGLICAVALAGLSLGGCAKKVNGTKVYKTEISSKATPVVGSKKDGLIKVSGKTSAPNGYKVVAIDNKGKSTLVGSDNDMDTSTQVKNKKFTGYINPLESNSKAKKGTKLKYHIVAVANAKRLDNPSKSTTKQLDKKFKPQTIKLAVDPSAFYVQSKVQKSLGKDAIVSKRSNTVYAITPKKDSDFENEVSKAIYEKSDNWSNITNKINQLSKSVKTSNGHIALVLINPDNHKKFLFVSLNGKTKYDAIKTNTVNSDKTNISNTAKASNGTSAGGAYGDDDMALAMILGYLMGASDTDDDSYSTDTNDNYNYDDSYSDDYDNSYSDNGSNDTSDSSQLSGETNSQAVDSTAIPAQ